MFFFGILRNFGGNRKKEEKLENLCIIRLLLHSVGNPRRSVGNPRRSVDLRQGVGYPRCGEAEVPKWIPSSTPQRSTAAPQRSYYS